MPTYPQRTLTCCKGLCSSVLIACYQSLNRHRELAHLGSGVGMLVGKSLCGHAHNKAAVVSQENDTAKLLEVRLPRPPPLFPGEGLDSHP